MEEKAVEIVSTVRPTIWSYLSLFIGWITAWWAGLSPMAQALLVIQGADILTGVLCAITHRSHKTESGGVSSGALFMGVAKKGLEWLVVLICYFAGAALEMKGITGAAMAYMMTTELVSMIENLSLFGLHVPILDKVLDIAKNKGGGDEPET